MRKKNLVFIFGPVVFWMAVIFGFSSMPTVKTDMVYWWDFVIKKTAHLVEYFVLTILLYRGLLYYEGKGFSKKKILIVCVIFIFLYGASDEIHQSFTPGREARFRDVVVDTAGSLIGLWYIKNSFPIAPRKLVRWVLGGQKS